MNHQHFKEWLVTDDPLTPEESQILDEHLKDCEACQQLQTAWYEINHLIKTTPELEPIPGFVERWQARLVYQRRISQKRLTWIVFVSLASITSIIMILLGYQFFEILRSPQQVALIFFSRVAVLISYLNMTRDYLSFFSIYLPEIPLPIIILSSGFIVFLCVLWLATIKKISSAWRTLK